MADKFSRFITLVTLQFFRSTALVTLLKRPTMRLPGLANLISLIMIVISCDTVSAQFTDSTTKYISYGATGVINNTNDGDSYVLNNNFRFNVRRKDVTLNAGSSWIYGEQNGRKTNNDFNSSIDFNLFKTFPHFYYWGLATYEKSFSLKINDRAQIGLGGAYNIFDRKELFFNLSEGVMFEKSDVFLNDTARERNTILRNSFRIRYRWTIKEFITLDGTHFIQNSLKEASDYIIKSNSNLSFKLYKWLSFTTSLTYNKVNKTSRENMLITFGLTAEKYF